MSPRAVRVPVPAWPPAVAAAAVAVAAVVSVVLAGSDDGPVWCPWRRCTGAYCPGCGATRSARALLGGDVAGSWRLHPMVLVVGIQVALYALVRVARPGTARQLAGRVLPIVVASNATALVAVWVVRLATGAIPGFGG